MVYGRFDSKIRFENESDGRFDSRFDSNEKNDSQVPSVNVNFKRQICFNFLILSVPFLVINISEKQAVFHDHPVKIRIAISSLVLLRIANSNT